jgi:hypothetical protein
MVSNFRTSAQYLGSAFSGQVGHRAELVTFTHRRFSVSAGNGSSALRCGLTLIA